MTRPFDPIEPAAWRDHSAEERDKPPCMGDACDQRDERGGDREDETEPRGFELGYN